MSCRRAEINLDIPEFITGKINDTGIKLPTEPDAPEVRPRLFRETSFYSSRRFAQTRTPSFREFAHMNASIHMQRPLDTLSQLKSNQEPLVVSTASDERIPSRPLAGEQMCHQDTEGPLFAALTSCQTR
jgi:hypothetical protein